MDVTVSLKIELDTSASLSELESQIQQVWAIPGRIKLTDKGMQRVRLRGAHPRARDVCSGFRPLLATSHLEVVLD